MTDREKLIALAERFSCLNAPDLGLQYIGRSGGEQRFDEVTGEPYSTTPRPSKLTVYGERAEFLMDVITKHSHEFANALRARAHTSKETNNDAD